VSGTVTKNEDGTYKFVAHNPALMPVNMPEELGTMAIGNSAGERGTMGGTATLGEGLFKPESEVTPG